MDLVYSMPGQPHRLFLNIVHACPNRCHFCVDFVGSSFFGFDLKGGRVESCDEIMAAVAEYPGREAVREVYVCGIGEPLLLYDLACSAAHGVRTLLRKDCKIGLNTSGTYYRFNRRVDFVDYFDLIQVSLNAENAEKYEAICRPRHSGTFDIVMQFLTALKGRLEESGSSTQVELSVVNTSENRENLPLRGLEDEAVPVPDIVRCREIAEEFGWPLKIKPLLNRDFASAEWSRFASAIRSGCTPKEALRRTEAAQAEN